MGASREARTSAGAGRASASTQLRGWRLVAARALVFPVFAFAVALFVVALPGAVARLTTPCADWFNTCLLSPQQAQRLTSLGVAPHTLAIAIAALSCLAMLVASGMGALLIWRRSDDWMALLVGLTLALAAIQFTPISAGASGYWQGPGQIVGSAGVPLLGLLILLFPSGRFAPRWIWLPAVALVVPLVTIADSQPPIVGLLLALASASLLIASQVYRYLRVSTPAQRQQTKWVVYGFALVLILNQLFWQTYGNIPGLARPDSLYFLLFIPDYILIVVVLAVCFGVAVLRHRLYDIDVIIRRTLVYGALSATLVALYFVLVLSLQFGAQRIAGIHGEQPVITVLSTLLIAALVTPLRRWLQAVIDRRFYRRKYDAARTAAAFSATLRAETDLDALSQRLAQVVDDTMQPAHLSLWLAPDNDAARSRALPS